MTRKHSSRSDPAEDQLLADLLEQVAEQAERGEHLELGTLITEYPQYERPLRQMFPAIQAMTRLSQEEIATPTRGKSPLRGRRALITVPSPARLKTHSGKLQAELSSERTRSGSHPL